MAQASPPVQPESSSTSTAAAVEVLCIGHACLDLIVPVPYFPAENGTLAVYALTEWGGGPAANAAWLLASWGVPTAFAGLIGDDSQGRRVAEELHGAGADISLLEQRPGSVTPLSIVIVNTANGSRTIINRKPAQAFLASGHLDAARWVPRVLLFDGHEPTASLEAIARFPQARTVLDAGSLREGTRLLASRVDCLVASERFARSLSGVPELDTRESRDRCLAALRAVNPRGELVVTLGERGLIHDSGGRTVHLPAYAVQAVDTTAAGDIFHGAFVYGLLQGWPLADILRFSAWTAALSVQVRGGRTSVPSLPAALAVFGTDRPDTVSGADCPQTRYGTDCPQTRYETSRPEKEANR